MNGISMLTFSFIYLMTNSFKKLHRIKQVPEAVKEAFVDECSLIKYEHPFATNSTMNTTRKMIESSCSFQESN